MLDLKSINKSWTIFLDRDGVINHEKYMDYVYSYDEFLFYEAVPESIKILSEIVGRIIVTTNQRGVGKGYMTEDALKTIHSGMIKDVKAAGGRIDRIYYCTAVNNDHPNRKPNPGMALQARRDFPGIDFRRSIMVGNNLSDMHFGKSAGMFTVFIKTTHPNQEFPHLDIDLAFDSLIEFARAL